MRRSIPAIAGILLLAGTHAGFSQTQVTRADEATLSAVWKVHLEATNDSPKVIASCQEFRKASPNSPLGVVADGLAAWHYLKVNDPAAATGILERMLSQQSDPLGKVASTMGRRWLTRMDREKVRLSLKYLYREAIEFPPTLDAMKTLPADKRGPLTDRWGQSWSYRLTEFKSPNLKNLRGQRYELQSAMLRDDSDLAAALKRPYASRINLKPGKVVISTPGRETVEFVTADEKQQKKVLSLGTESDGMTFPFLGSGIVILSDGDHWAVLPKSK